MVISPHGAMAAGWHVNGAAGYAGCLVGPRALHGHVGWTCRSRQRLKGHETLKHIFFEMQTYMYGLHISENNNSTQVVGKVVIFLFYGAILFF